MQIIQLPSYVIARLEQYQKNFLWGTTSQKKRLHMIKWEVIMTPKNEGGLGIQKLKEKK